MTSGTTITLTARENNQRADWRIAYSRPALMGSEKQVAWAGDNRAKIEREIIAFVCAQAKTHVDTVFNASDAGCPQWIAAQSAVDAVLAMSGQQHGIDKTIGEVIEIALSETSAKWWIDQASITSGQALVISTIKRLAGK